MSYTYDSIVTYDPGTNRLIKNAAGNVYDPADTAYATPLEVTDIDGNVMDSIVSNDSGVLPQFVSDLPRLRWKAASFQPIEIGSPQMYADAAAASQAAAEAAQAAAEAAQETAQAPAEDVVRDVVQSDLAVPTSPITDAVLGATSDAFAPRAEPTKHAPALGLYFPEAETGGLAAALTTQATAGTGAVYLSASTYETAGTLNVPAGAVIRGSHPSATIKLTASATQGVRLNGAARVENLTIDLQQLATSYGVQVIAAAAGSVIENCLITNGNGPTLSAVGAKIEGTATIRNCTFTNIATPIQVTGATPGVRIENCTLTDWTQRGIYILGSSGAAASDLWITGNKINPNNALAGAAQARQPIAFQGVDATPFRNVHVLNNVVIGPGTSHDPTSGQLAGGTQYGSADLISLHQCDQFEVIGNTATDSGDVGITVSMQCTNGIISNNVCMRNDSAGISVGSSTSTYFRNVAVSGNTCINNGQNRAADGPDWASNGINLQNCDGVILSGNRCGDDQVTKTQKYGIAVQNSLEVTIATNDLSGNGLGEIYQASNTGPINLPASSTAPKISTLTADTTVNNSTTLTASGLSVNVEANAVYRVEGYLIVNASQAGGFQYKFNGPASATMNWSTDSFASTATAATSTINRTNWTIGSTNAVGGPDSSNFVSLPVGLLKTGATAGALTVTFSQATANASNCILRSGSWLTLTRIS